MLEFGLESEFGATVPTKRPDPEHLLERVSAEDPRRGRLKIYLGMAAGAGKTFSMLSDALTAKQRGLDIVAGYIEPHGRVETEQLAAQLESLPVRTLTHNGLSVNEFDLDGALKRHPQVLLVDELAHSNASGSRHTKRWQDIEECLAQGINVYTTLNVQHIESLSDVVTRITGASVYETVPDAVVRKADEIELIDITPDELIQRIRDGKVYLTDKVESALSNFFKPGNLLALRELVLRVTAERVDEQLITFRRLHDVNQIWPTKPRVLVCVSPNYPAESLVRAAWRLATSLRTDLLALTVENVTRTEEWQARGKRIKSGLELAESLGAQIVRSTGDDTVAEILRVAKERNATIIVVGKSMRSRVSEYLFSSFVDQLIRASGDLDMYVIANKTQAEYKPLTQKVTRPSWSGVFSALFLTSATTLVCILAYPFMDLSNLIMIYLLAVAWAGSKLGRVESVITSVLSVLAFDYCFVPPRWTFAVSDMQYFVTFTVMLVIALLISTLTMQLKSQAQSINRRERRTAALYEVSKRLASAASPAQIAAVVHQASFNLFGCPGQLFVPNASAELESFAHGLNHNPTNQNEMAVARWVATHRIPAGLNTETLAGSKGQYIPVSPNSTPSAVLALFYAENKHQLPSDALVEAFATQIGSALERVMAEVESTSVQLQVERERVRNLLLSSISHDFRSPLAAISGAADTLVEQDSSLNPHQSELVNSIRDQSHRLSRLVRNVLDLTRLEAGEIQLRIEWESVEELIGSALERTQSLLGKRSIDIQLPQNLPLLQVDATLMEQVFVNFFENIAKHTPDTTQIWLSARIEKQRLIVSLIDNGPGLPKGHESQIFEKAFRGPSAQEGFGLGLTICQAVMRAHAGEISAVNRSTGGAQFELAFPLPHRQPEVSNEG